MAKRKIPVVLDEDEQAALIAQPNPRYPTGERNRTMLLVMLDAGLRVSEVAALKWRDVNLMTGQLAVRQGKGSKDRILWVNDEARDALRSWRERQAAYLQEHGVEQAEHVFSNLKGKPVQVRYVQRMVKRYASKANIEKDITPHTLRHTFATDLLRATKNLIYVQQSLGHAYVSTTQIYCHATNEDLEHAMKTFRQRRSEHEHREERGATIAPASEAIGNECPEVPGPKSSP